ncbi:MAG: RpiB/LacA/LacB family sugar-phosphate isomerase [Vampirovibrionales bacterium]|nr:RpiB/LacA/LacB family sugar-phosphate isomerase [Vampirovibrionales bacterium]
MPSILLAADHGGFTLKEALKEHLTQQGFEIIDMGCHSTDAVDYPAVTQSALLRLHAEGIESGAIKGILCCGSGVGVCIAANRFVFARAVWANDVSTALWSRRHNDTNILCMGGRVTAAPRAAEIVDAWLAEPFDGDRHQPRVDELSAVGQTVRC